MGMRKNRVFFISLAITLFPVFVLAIEPDKYEDDDKSELAHLIFLSSENGPQKHNFHKAGDEDWVMFLGISGKRYTIETSNLGTGSDPGLELYDTDSATMLKGPLSSRLSWTFQKDGFYFVRVRNYDPDVFGDNTEYDLDLFEPFGELPGHINGVVTNVFSGNPIAGAVIKTGGGVSVKSSDGFSEGKYYPNLDGVYIIVGHESGDYDLTAQISGYITFSDKVEIKATLTTEKNISLFRDFDGNNKTDLADAVTALQILAGLRTGLNTGMEDVIGILNISVAIGN